MLIDEIKKDLRGITKWLIINTLWTILCITAVFYYWNIAQDDTQVLSLTWAMSLGIAISVEIRLIINYRDFRKLYKQAKELARLKGKSSTHFPNANVCFDIIEEDQDGDTRIIKKVEMKGVSITIGDTELIREK